MDANRPPAAIEGPSEPSARPAPDAEVTPQDESAAGDVTHRRSFSEKLFAALKAWVMLSIIAFVVGALIAKDKPDLMGWLGEHRTHLLLAYGGLTALIVVLSQVTFVASWLRKASESTKSAMVIFLAIPALVLAVLAVPFLPPQQRVTVVHVIFTLVLCLLPGAMYYLFLVARRPSILNEFVANLTRLGLLGERAAHLPNFNPTVHRRRVESYLQRFEAMYGPIHNQRDKLIDELANTTPARERQHSPAAIAYSRGRATDITQVFPREVLVQLCFTTLLMAIGWLLVLPPDLTAGSTGDAVAAGPQGAGFPGSESGRGPLVPELTPVNVAFLGAYFFSLQMLFRRFVRRDLNVRVYVNICVRTILAIIGAWMIAVIWTLLMPGSQAGIYDLLDSGFHGPAGSDVSILLVAFVCGVFPRTLWQLIVAASQRIPGVRTLLPGLQSGQPLSQLDGVTVWHEARFEEEDVENVANLASADPLELMLQTRLPPERLMRWMDEAILLTSLGDAGNRKGADAGTASMTRERLAHSGILTATDLFIASRHSCPADPALRKQLGPDVLPVMDQVARALGSRASNFTLVLEWYGIDPGATIAGDDAVLTLDAPDETGSAPHVALSELVPANVLKVAGA